MAIELSDLQIIFGDKWPKALRLGKMVLASQAWLTHLKEQQESQSAQGTTVPWHTAVQFTRLVQQEKLEFFRTALSQQDQQPEVFYAALYKLVEVQAQGREIDYLRIKKRHLLKAIHDKEASFRDHFSWWTAIKAQAMLCVTQQPSYQFGIQTGEVVLKGMDEMVPSMLTYLKDRCGIEDVALLSVELTEDEKNIPVVALGVSYSLLTFLFTSSYGLRLLFFCTGYYPGIPMRAYTYELVMMINRVWQSYVSQWFNVDRYLENEKWLTFISGLLIHLILYQEEHVGVSAFAYGATLATAFLATQGVNCLLKPRINHDLLSIAATLTHTLVFMLMYACAVDFAKECGSLAQLGLFSCPSAKEVSKAYKQLSLQWHPDKPGGNEAFFNQVRDANEFLKDRTLLCQSFSLG